MLVKLASADPHLPRNTKPKHPYYLFIYLVIYILHFFYIFMHLADAFIQSDL